jgi:acetoin utilization deacetylase AcuC-like enzyme
MRLNRAKRETAMKMIFGEAQNRHAPARFLRFGHVVDYPESPERVARLVAGARAAGLEPMAPGEFDLAHIRAVHSERYLEFLRHGHADWAALPGAHAEMMPSLRPVEQPAGYPRHILGRAGWHIMDFAGAVTAETWEAARVSANAALTAAELVLGGAPAAYALCRPPGHHAFAERAGGFCYLNNAAIAAQYLRAGQARVAILDIDVHHGNGTQGIFYERADVLTVSIHADPAQYYPFFYGYADQTGSGAGAGCNLNLPVPVKAGDAAWLAALDQALARLRDFGPGALVLALGLDAHEADPLAGGAVTTAGFAAMARAIAVFDRPTVLVQEGGYLTPFLAGNLTAFLRAFQGGG